MKVRISWESRKAPLLYPLESQPRIAVLGPWFREAGTVRVFRRGWNQESSRFAPQAIAGTWRQLQELAQNRAAQPTHAVIVIARAGMPLLSHADREQLWRAFQVPVFEQIVGVCGKLLAAECEAHDGLHLESEGVTAPGFLLDQSPCACGRKTPRLIPEARAERARAAAAYAR